ncbi:MAG: dihydroxyacetone kinase subunit DhaL [Chloroflexota bacterium]
MLSGQDCVALIIAMRDEIEANRDRLSALDGKIGDGDHGVNLTTAVSQAAHAVQQLSDPTPAQVMRTVGSTLINEMGGAAGIIFGSFFRGGSRAIKGKEKFSLEEVATFMEAGLAEVQKRGKAQPGDKTLVDALFPAVEVMKTAVSADMPLSEAMTQAAQAAQAGAESTTNMVAKFGRAKFLGNRALGHQDAGATSMALILQVWAQFIHKQEEEQHNEHHS